MDNIKIAKQVLNIAKALISNIEVKEDESVFRVLGPYMEMKDVYPKLKNRGFKYDPREKSWNINKSKYKNIEEVKDLVEKIQGKNAEKIEKLKEENERRFKEIVDKCKKFKYVSVFQDGEGLLVKAPYDWFSDEFYKLGGKWVGKMFKFSEPKEEIYNIISNFEGMIEKRIDQVKKFDQKIIGSGPYTIKLRLLGIDLFLKSSHIDLRDIVKRTFPKARWNGQEWKVSVANVYDIDEAVKKLEEGCRPLIRRFVEKQNIEETKKKDSPLKIRYCTNYGEDMRYYRTGDIVKNIWSKSPDLLKITSVKYDGKYEGDDYFFVVTYEPLSELEMERYNLEKLKKEGVNKANERIREIIEIIQTRGQCPKKLEITGDKYITTKSEQNSIFGGGEWINIDDDRVFYVKNNGSDGDDWSRNNVETGGAGGIGWILKDSEISKELLRLFKIAGWNKR